MIAQIAGLPVSGIRIDGGIVPNLEMVWEKRYNLILSMLRGEPAVRHALICNFVIQQFNEIYKVINYVRK